ncbi:MAG TPA: class I SAM-dependent methyltransferase [Candidatus Binatia bacterium]|jgi:SAM-dependent methyltransferase|nr:class I SAM-dependent methyltransferase [Candidatus Binatia bacterium]
MIKVLRDWREIGQACLYFAQEGLPRHTSCEKTWDLYNLCVLLRSLPRHSRLIDLGCGGLCCLRLAWAMGFSDLYGVDLKITWRERLSQLSRMWRGKTLRPPFALRRMDISRLKFSDATFDIAVSISTIEHGVDLPRFFGEASRVLKRDGLLFVTTDYWDERIPVDNSFRAFGKPWSIFDREDVIGMLRIAADAGLSLIDPARVRLECGERCVGWGGKQYTFINLVFRKGVEVRAEPLQVELMENSR